MHFGRRHVHLWGNKYLCAVPGLTAVGLLLLLSGCAMVGPNYSPVQPDSPQGWTAAMEKGLEATRPQNGTLAQWWAVFDDPVLSRLEKQAVKGNLDLKIALSRLRQARLNRGISKSGLFPSMSADSRVQRQRGSESMPSMSGGQEQDYYLGQFDSAWELDLFGGIQRSVQAAQAELEASRAGVNEVLISLMAEVALNYTEVRTYQRRLQITRSNITNQKKSYDLNKSRYESGLIDELAVQQSLRNLERTRSQISSLQTGLQAAKNRLAVLMGLTPGALESELSQAKAIPDIPSQVAVGIPAEAMRRRPDIQRAERQLAAQTARIGVATAELYPKFHLLGSIGLEAVDGLTQARRRSDAISQQIQILVRRLDPEFDAGDHLDPITFLDGRLKRREHVVIGDRYRFEVCASGGARERVERERPVGPTRVHVEVCNDHRQ